MIGQRCVQQQIKTAVEGQSLARFIILVGDIGSGRKTLAGEIARMIKANCIIVDKGVDSVREVIEQSYQSTSNTLYVFDNDAMSQSAKSALLKVTEEPPNNVRFVLITTNLEMTLPTLVSRACVYRMDNYTDDEIAEFADTKDWRFPNYCSNKYEVDLLKKYGIDEFEKYVKTVVDHISEVSGANALKIGQKIAFKDEEDKYDMKVFLQAFKTECLDRTQQIVDDYPDKLVYLEWISITNLTLDSVRTSTYNRQYLFDTWVFDIRKASKIAKRQ